MKAASIQAHAHAHGGVKDATRSSQGRTVGYDLVVFDMDGTLADSFGFFIRTHNLLSAKYLPAHSTA